MIESARAQSHLELLRSVGAPSFVAGGSPATQAKTIGVRCMIEWGNDLELAMLLSC